MILVGIALFFVFALLLNLFIPEYQKKKQAEPQCPPHAWVRTDELKCSKCGVKFTEQRL